MIKDQFFPLETSIINDDKVYRLIEKMGMKGLGLYLMMLMELRRHDHYTGGVTAIRSVSRQAKVTFPTVEDVVLNFNLFTIEGTEEEMIISSPYLTRVMESWTKRKAKRVKSEEDSDENSERLPDDESDVNDRPNNIISYNIISEEKDKKENSSSSSIPYWEKYINEAMNDESWSDIQAKISGMGLNFFSWKIDICRLFKEHVMAQGSHERIVSLGDAKAYFSNFIRSGTKTNEWVKETIKQLEEKAKKVDLYRFETIDSETGARSYFGVTIPPDAPPRPSFVAVWDKASECWDE